ncbi:hypothetical protein Acr_02g0005700 [Actinidia rufa]|uniref:UDP-Glycosyltransferase superfamily protein n=1 Tax=Actinidia rufa TaxID=165716 RepID=A0A7J0E7E9_9ERIC|nr:hypothetical protein Acr_02g0005700 [Actinidia rufa]
MLRSEASLNRRKEQIYEIAYGLEESHLPFIWALRKPSWAIDDSDALPPGFSQSSNKHKFGHTLVVLPFSGDHGFNARLVVEKGLAMEVDHGEDGSFKRDDIAKSLKTIHGFGGRRGNESSVESSRGVCRRPKASGSLR